MCGSRRFLRVWRSFWRCFLVVALRRCLPTRLVFLFLGLRSQVKQFPELERITFDPMIMGGKPCIRGMRITVGTIVGLVGSSPTQPKVRGDRTHHLAAMAWVYILRDRLGGIISASSSLSAPLFEEDRSKSCSASRERRLILLPNQNTQGLGYSAPESLRLQSTECVNCGEVGISDEVS